MDFAQCAADLARFGVVRTDADMSEYTTFKTGGRADCMIYPPTVENAASIVRYANERNIPLTVIGGGSNLIVGDRGIRGIVVRISGDDVRPGRIETMADGRVWADAAAKKRDLIDFAVTRGFGDCIFMVGVPGCVGGGIIMNAGTFMGNFIDILDSVVYIDKKGNICEVRVDRSMAHYRGIDLPDLAIVWGGYFSFRRKGDTAELRRKVDEIIADRRMKHPQDPSAGSVFKNPEGHFSWKLVNDAGLKGKRIGGAMVSELHTNFIINAGGATSADIRELIAFVQATVQERFGVELHPEVRTLGEN